MTRIGSETDSAFGDGFSSKAGGGTDLITGAKFQW